MYYSQTAQIWCQSEEGILSRQLSCLEATARHAQVGPRTSFFVYKQNGAPAHREHNTVTFLEREIERETRRCLSACVRVRGAHFEDGPICHHN